MTVPHRSFTARAVAAALVPLIALTSSGCVITQTGNPPYQPERPDILADGIAPAVNQPQSEREILIVGAPGTVDPPTGAIVAINLSDSSVVPVRVPVEADGGFAVTVPSRPGDEIRLAVATRGARSLPIDVVRFDAESIVPRPRPFAGCLEVAPAADVPYLAAGAAVVQVTNACDGVIELGAATLLFGDHGFAIAADGPTGILAAGASGEIRVTLVADSSAVEDEILFVNVFGAEIGSIAITLYRATPM